MNVHKKHSLFSFKGGLQITAFDSFFWWVWYVLNFSKDDICIHEFLYLSAYKQLNSEIDLFFSRSSTMSAHSSFPCLYNAIS